MPEAPGKAKAILAADIASYSPLMGADDDSDGPRSQVAPGRHLADDQWPLRVDHRHAGFLAEFLS